MTDVKEHVAAAIVKARENLEQALSDLERLPRLTRVRSPSLRMPSTTI